MVIDFVSGNPGDAELAAQRSHALPILEPQHKPHAFFHDGPLLPWHRRLLAGLIQPGGVNHVSGTLCIGMIRTHTLVQSTGHPSWKSWEPRRIDTEFSGCLVSSRNDLPKASLAPLPGLQCRLSCSGGCHAG